MITADGYAGPVEHTAIAGVVISSVAGPNAFGTLLEQIPNWPVCRYTAVEILWGSDFDYRSDH